MEEDDLETKKEISPELKNIAFDYWLKWQKIGRSTTRINRQDASEAIKAAYGALCAQAPEIIFCDSFNAGLDFLRKNPQIRKEDENWDWHRRIRIQLIIRPDQNITSQIGRTILPDSEEKEQRLRSIPSYAPQRLLLHRTSLLYWAQVFVWRFNFAYSVLGCEHCDHNPRKWEALKLLVEHCGCFWATHKVCVVSDRPVKLLFKDDRLHAEGEPAILYADGSKHYAYNGREIPEKYGEVCSSQWNTQWLLEEKDFELQTLLIETIGYARIFQELPVKKIDSTEKYILWKIETIEGEPICLLQIINSDKNENVFFIVPPLDQNITYPPMFPELPGNKIDTENKYILWKIGKENLNLICLLQTNWPEEGKSFKRVSPQINSIAEAENYL